MKYLIACCDDTWNTPQQEQLGLPAPTNVVKIQNCLSQMSDPGKDRYPSADGEPAHQEPCRQLAYYHTGVGTEGTWLQRKLGGAMGAGLDKNIKSAHHWIARNYELGDRICLFGYSRGAYTVRSLGGMLSSCGLLDLSDAIDSPTGWSRVDHVFDKGYWVKKAGRAPDWLPTDWPMHHKEATPIRFIGVWDTVGALGVPDNLFVADLLDDPQELDVPRHALGHQCAGRPSRGRDR